MDTELYVIVHIHKLGALLWQHLSIYEAFEISSSCESKLAPSFSLKHKTLKGSEQAPKEILYLGPHSET